MKNIPVLVFLWASLLCIPLRAATEATTSGNCSPALAQTEVSGSVVVNCANGQHELLEIATTVNQMVSQQKFARSQVQRLITLINTLISIGPQVNRIESDSRQANINTQEILGRLRKLAQEPAQPDEMLSELQGWVQEHQSPKAQRFASILAEFNRNSSTTVHASLSEPVYTVFMRTTDGKRMIYIFRSEKDYSESRNGNSPRCRVQDGIYVSGVAASGSLDTTGLAANMTAMSGDDTKLRRICWGLAQPASQLLTNPSSTGHASAERSVFDYVSRGFGQLYIVVAANEDESAMRFDAAMARGYWGTALLTSYVGRNAAQLDETDPDTSSQLEGLAGGGSFQLERRIPQQFTIRDAQHPYPDAAVRDYGPYLQDMDQKWLEYLRSASVTIHGTKSNIMESGAFRPILAEFTPDELGTPTFWRHVADLSIFFDQLNCIGARFAVDNGYARPFDLPGYDQCSIWQIRSDTE